MTVFKILSPLKGEKLDLLEDNFIYFMTVSIPAVMQTNFPKGEKVIINKIDDI